MEKTINYGEETRSELKVGVDILAKAVKITLGPKGRNVLIKRHMKEPLVTKDGVTVAKAIELKDQVQNMGAQLVKEVASKTNDLAGDGTTTATVLAQAIFHEGLKYLAAGHSPVAMKKGIDLAIGIVKQSLEAQAVLIGDDLEKVKQVAMVSANNDEEIGELIATAFKGVGREGVISFVESNAFETTVEITEGVQITRGYLSPYFCTEEEKKITEYADALVFITDKKLSSNSDILPVLKFASEKKRPLLIIADDVERQALSTLIVNKHNGILKVVAITAPGFGDRKRDLLMDLSIATGAKYFNSELPGDFVKFDGEFHLGSVKNLKVTNELTTFLPESNDAIKERVAKRLESLREQKEAEPDGYEKQKLVDRISMLGKGFAVIHVGATSEVEMKEKRDRIEDAINATKSAVEEGIVEGGGVALLRSIKELDFIAQDDQNVQAGVNIIKKILRTPITVIAENAEISAEVVIDKILSSKKPIGFDFKEEEYVDMIKAGIIDPKKVTRVALENAASVASMLLTTECTISYENTDQYSPFNE